MPTQSKSTEQDGKPPTDPQDEFVRQVEDHSRSAQEVLLDQHDAHSLDERPAVFVP